MVQCPKSRLWRVRGKIVEAREGFDGKNKSFIVKLENGNESIRHKSHIKHDVGSNSRTEKVRVSFSDDVTVNKPPDDATAQNNPDDSSNSSSKPAFIMTRGRKRIESLKSSLKTSRSLSL